MSFAAEVAEAFARVGLEIKAGRGQNGSGESSWTAGPYASAKPNYFTAAKSTKTTPLRFAILSDSTSDGYTEGQAGGSTSWNDVWPNRLPRLLRNQLGLAPGGAGWVPPKPPVYVGGYSYNTAVQEPTAYTEYDNLNWQIGVPGGLWLQEGHESRKYRVRYSLTPGTTSIDVVTTRYSDGVVNITCENSASSTTVFGDATREKTRVNNPGAWVQLEGAPGIGFALLGIFEHVGDETNGVQMMNLAQAAIKASEVLGWLQDPVFSTKPMLAAYEPDVVLICLGSNDLGQAVKPTSSQLVTTMLGIATELKGVLPNVEIVYVIRPNEGVGAEWDAFSTLLISSASQVGATTLDVRSDARLGAYGNSTYYLPDDVHFTAAGDEAMANIVAEYFSVKNGSGLSREEVQTIVDDTIVNNIPLIQGMIDAALLAKPRFWSSEVIINSSGLADGYNDNVGGVLVDNDIILYQASFRIADPTALIGGTGNLQIQWYAGSATALETELITTTQIAAGEHDVIVTFATPMPYTINTVLRAKITRGSTTVNGPCHIQWRGRYR